MMADQHADLGMNQCLISEDSWKLPDKRKALKIKRELEHTPGNASMDYRTNLMLFIFTDDGSRGSVLLSAALFSATEDYQRQKVTNNAYHGDWYHQVDFAETSDAFHVFCIIRGEFAMQLPA